MDYLDRRSNIRRYHRESCCIKAISLICGFLVFMVGCSSVRTISAFSEELIAMIHDKYELFIPNSAEFYSGYYDNALQDNGIYLSFSVSVQEFEKLFSDNWEKSNSDCTDQALLEMIEKPIDHMYTYQKQMYTYLICSTSENNRVTCAFHGRWPEIVA